MKHARQKCNGTSPQISPGILGKEESFRSPSLHVFRILIVKIPIDEWPPNVQIFFKMQGHTCVEHCYECLVLLSTLLEELSTLPYFFYKWSHALCCYNRDNGLNMERAVPESVLVEYVQSGREFIAEERLTGGFCWNC